MKKLLLIIVLAIGFNFSASAQNIDTEQLEEQLGQMQEHMTKFFEQLSSSMEDGKVFFIDTSFVEKYDSIELDDLNEDGEVSVEEIGQHMEMMTKMMMKDILKFAEGMEDLPFFEELKQMNPAPKGSENGQQSDKLKKKRTTRTL